MKVALMGRFYRPAHAAPSEPLRPPRHMPVRDSSDSLAPLQGRLVGG
jgi:hypothetical protein